MNKGPVTPHGDTRHISLLKQQSRLLDTVYDRLCDAIFHHEIAPGSRLSVPMLAARFGVSRSPIKEAVQQLVSDGIAESIPRRGVFVAKFDLPDLVNLLEIMIPLEEMAGRQAAEHVTEEDIEALGNIVRQLETAAETGDASVYAKWDSTFHHTIVRIARNERLEYFLRILHNQMRLVSRLMFASPTMVKSSLIDHKAIFRALKSRDPKKTGEALSSHVARSRVKLQKHVASTIHD